MEKRLGDVDHEVSHGLKLRQHVKVVVDCEELVRTFLDLEDAFIPKGVTVSLMMSSAL